MYLPSRWHGPAISRFLLPDDRLGLSLKEQSDVQSALAGVQEVGMWEKIVGTIPPRVVAVIGDAIRVRRSST